jgi:hypothetical protein
MLQRSHDSAVSDIPANLFMLQRSHDSAVSDIPANLIYIASA